MPVPVSQVTLNTRARLSVLQTWTRAVAARRRSAVGRWSPPIRWKLILGIGCPLAVLLGVLLRYDFVSMREQAFALAQERTSERAERYATALDGDCRAIEQVALASARFLEVNPEPTEAQLYEQLRGNVVSNPLIYGSCVAFEPNQLRRDTGGAPPSLLPVAPAPRPRPNPDLFCPYVYRGEEGLLRMDVADAYDYLDPKWEWYREPRRTGRAFWTEPFFDEGAGNVEMVTYVAPFFRDGSFRGTVNVDVRLDVLRGRAREAVRTGTDVYLMSRGGVFIVAPDPELVMAGPALDAAARHSGIELRTLVERMLTGRYGTETVQGEHGRQVQFIAPVPSTGWALAGVADEAAIMWPVYASLRVRSFAGISAATLVLGAALLMGIWIVRPVARLADAVSSLSGGNLEARVAGVDANDEIGRLGRAYNGMLDRLQGHVAELQKETAARQAIESELRAARTIQKSLLPREFPELRGASVFARSEPARQVGGDFFDVFSADGRTLTFLVADVSGKGMAAALFMAVARTLIRDLAAVGPESPGRILRKADEMLRRDNREGMFLTVFLGHFDPATGAVRYANAGHPKPRVIDRAGGLRVFGRTTGTVLGVLQDETVEEFEDRLDTGERMVLYTDGVTEARSAGGVFLGSSGLDGVLEESEALDARSLCDAIIRRVDEYQDGARADDVTVMVVANAG